MAWSGTAVLGRVALASCAVIAGCGRVGFEPAPVPTVELTAAPAYPLAGAGWNDYVANDGADRWSASDTPCPVSATPYSACLHGGELRKVTVDGVASCDGLVLVDELGVFDWRCVDGALPTFYGALAPNRGLRDLVTEGGWIANRVVVVGSARGETAMEPWWENPVVSLPDNTAPGAGVVTLATPGTIYLLPSSRTTDGYQITASRVGLVTLAKSVLYRNPTTGNTDCLVSTSGSDQVWIEANIDLTSTGPRGICVRSARFAQLYASHVVGGNPAIVCDGMTSSQFRHVRASDSLQEGIVIGEVASCDDNYFFDLVADGSQSTNLHVNAGARDVFEGVVVANGARRGLAVGPYCAPGSAHLDTFIGVRAINNLEEGVFINDTDHTFVDVLSVGNGRIGIALSNACGYAWGSTLSDVVSAFNADVGVSAVVDSVVLNNVVTIGNGTYGLELDDFVTVTNFAASDSLGRDVHQATNGSEFHGGLLVAAPSSCFNDSGQPGVEDGTCAPSGLSTATLYLKGSLLGDFVQTVTDDSTNPTPGAIASYPSRSSGLDWSHFDNPYRVWGRWGALGQWTSGTATILDFRVRGNGSKIVDNTDSPSARNQPFVAGATCPNGVAGTRVATAHREMEGNGYLDVVYLLNAVELVSPAHPGYQSAGNHDGLCESGEHCLYTPNFGAYQGEGELATCVFVDGTVSGVTMYGYTIPGA